LPTVIGEDPTKPLNPDVEGRFLKLPASGCLPLSVLGFLRVGERELCFFDGESLDPQNLIFPALAVLPDNPEM
jgi:hypothetical protein